MSKSPAVAEYYDQDYYAMRYGRLINDPSYYALSGAFWQYSIFTANGLSTEGPVLDWGSGPGHITAALNADCYDSSTYIQGFLLQKGRTSYRTIRDIPKEHYQTIVCSHALEHSLTPSQDLEILKAHLTQSGRLVLLLPVETSPGKPVSSYDENRHFYTWNFQAITNLLLNGGFAIVYEQVVHGPTGLGVLGKRLNLAAIRLAWQLGRLKKNYPSLLVVASRNGAAVGT